MLYCVALRCVALRCVVCCVVLCCVAMCVVLCYYRSDANNFKQVQERFPFRHVIEI